MEATTVAQTVPQIQVGMEFAVAPQVYVWGSSYLVIMPTPGWEYGEPHVVYKNKTCSCGDPKCKAIEAVRDYLCAGGQRAPDPVNGKAVLPGIPALCPLCGAEVVPDHTLSSPQAGAGWKCLADAAHYWIIRAATVKTFFTDPDHPSKRGLPRMTPEERAAFLAAHRLNYPAAA